MCIIRSKVRLKVQANFVRKIIDFLMKMISGSKELVLMFVIDRGL